MAAFLCGWVGECVIHTQNTTQPTKRKRTLMSKYYTHALACQVSMKKKGEKKIRPSVNAKCA